MVPMAEISQIEIPSGVNVKLEGSAMTIQGKRGSTVKRVDQRLLDVKVEVDSGKGTFLTLVDNVMVIGE